MAEFLQQCGSWGVLATLAAYAAGVWVNRKTGKALFNPLLMGSIFVIVFLSCFGVPYADYKASAQPVSWLLMPATVSLAIPLYEKFVSLCREKGIHTETGEFGAEMLVESVNDGPLTLVGDTDQLNA